MHECHFDKSNIKTFQVMTSKWQEKMLEILMTVCRGKEIRFENHLSNDVNNIILTEKSIMCAIITCFFLTKNNVKSLKVCRR